MRSLSLGVHHLARAHRLGDHQRQRWAACARRPRGEPSHRGGRGRDRGGPRSPSVTSSRDWSRVRRAGRRGRGAAGLRQLGRGSGRMPPGALACARSSDWQRVGPVGPGARRSGLPLDQLPVDVDAPRPAGPAGRTARPWSRCRTARARRFRFPRRSIVAPPWSPISPSAWGVKCPQAFGKTLFITGASRGIGLAIAMRAARDGANVAIVGQDHRAAPQAARHHPHRRRRDRGRRRPGAAARPRHPRRRRGRGGGGQTVRRALRRHRHPGQQRQRHLADRHAGHADEALRPDVRGQRPRHVLLLAGLPAPPAASRPRPGATRTSSTCRRR